MIKYFQKYNEIKEFLDMTKVITVPEEIRDLVQKTNVERDARRDILVFLMENSDVNIPPERFDKYQKEYDEKYLAFEQAKRKIEQEYVLPAVDGKPNNWSLDYSTCEITINVNE